jgi:hypothetical protein
LSRREQFYAAIFEMGFLFPHPRIQITPTQERIRAACGSSGSFVARISKRGFHLHTMHPSEWVNGFLMDDLGIADATVRWLVRNQQNLLQIQTLRTADPSHLKKALRIAHEAGIEVGFSAAFALVQQKALHLIPLWATLSRKSWRKPLQKNLEKILSEFDFDFLTAEMGTTEFTSTPPERTLEWMELTRSILSSRGKRLFIKIHTSTGQEDPKYGNYNFIARYAHEEVGVLPHTVMFYGLMDSATPVYGRKDFADIRQFMLEERDRRPTWFYPETSYYVGMDIDVPIFLTDYLTQRRSDFDDVVHQGVSGHLTFSTGQELGYWLFDWNVALQAWPQSADDPWLALRLLGEDVDLWKRITDFQHEFFNRRQIIRLISSSNLMDEISWFKPIHERTLLKELFKDKEQLNAEIDLLEQAVSAEPPITGVRNLELRAMLEVTSLRIRHALAVRKIIRGEKRAEWILEASRLRGEAGRLLEGVAQNFNRYPSSLAFRRIKNVTSYDEGYAATAVRLHFWEREELMAQSYSRASNPFFKNLYNIWKLLF